MIRRPFLALLAVCLSLNVLACRSKEASAPPDGHAATAAASSSPGSTPADTAGSAAAASNGIVQPPAVPSPDDYDDELAEVQKRVAAVVSKAPDGAASDTASQLERVFNALAALRRQLPREHFAPAAVVRKAGTDPVALATWVRDQTELVAYRGLLRGAPGVLMDRVGNSLDRAVLLYELLSQAGHQARLARTQVTGAALDVLKASLERPLPQLASADPDEAALVAAVDQSGLDRAALEREAAALAAVRMNIRERVEQRAQSQAAALAAALGNQARPDSGPERSALLTDHWFVQYRRGSSWEGLDPIPGREGLLPLGEAIGTFTPDKLPADLLHQVKVRVVAEVWRDGRLETAPLLEHTLVPARLYGHSVRLQMVAEDFPGVEKLVTAPNPRAALLEATVSGRAWYPVMLVGTTPILGKTITADGQVRETVAIAGVGRTAASLTRRALGGATGLFASLPGSPDNAAPDPNPTGAVLTAQWIEYEISAPGFPTKSVRRDLFDVIAPGARSASPIPRPELTREQTLARGLAQLTEVQILAVGAQVHPDYVTWVRASGMLALRDFLIEVARSRGGERPEPPAVPLMPGAVLELAAARGSFEPLAGRVYLDRPNVFALWRSIRSRDGVSAGIANVLDIVANYVAVRGGNAFAARLQQGVFDTNLEAALAGDCAECRPEYNTAELFAASGAAGRPWRVVASPASLNDDTGLDARVRARISYALADGAVAVIPSSLDPSANGLAAWWSVDPATGETLGMGPDGLGRGQEGPDYLTGLKVFVEAAFCAGAVVVGMVKGTASTWSTVTSSIVCAVGVGFSAGAPMAATETGSKIVELIGALLVGTGSVVGALY